MNVASKFSTLVQLLTMPRKRGDEQVRWSIDEITPDDGDPAQYVSGKLWFRGRDGEWRPGKQGLTIRRAELRQVIEALERAEKILSGKETIAHHNEDETGRAL